MIKKAVVTGGYGFIGSNLIKFLLKKNFFVINIDKINYASNHYNLKDASAHKNYKFFKADINNQKLLREVPYSIILKSNIKIVAQLSRLDTTSDYNSFMTSLGWGENV